MRHLRAGAALAASLLAPLPAASHPHILIDVHAVVEMREGAITSLMLGWTFDPVFSATLLEEFDANHDGTLDAAELKRLEKEAFRETVAKEGYFTYARVGESPVSWPAATDFRVVAVKDRLMYMFRLTLPRPVDPRHATFSVATYDESFYIDMDFPNERAVVLTGEGAAGCRAQIGPDRGNTIFGGLVVPRRVWIRCD